MNEHTLASLSSAEFGSLFIRYKQSFTIFAYSYIQDTSAAEDIVTESFMALWEKRSSLPADTKAAAYVMTTVRNKCLNWLRCRHSHLKIEQEIHTVRKRVIETNLKSLSLCDPQDLFADEISGITSRCLDAMPMRTRKIFEASRYLGKTYREISDELGISIRQAEYELNRALKMLRSALKDYLPHTLILLVTNWVT